MEQYTTRYLLTELRSIQW